MWKHRVFIGELANPRWCSRGLGGCKVQPRTLGSLARALNATLKALLFSQWTQKCSGVFLWSARLGLWTEYAFYPCSFWKRLAFPQFWWLVLEQGPTNSNHEDAFSFEHWKIPIFFSSTGGDGRQEVLGVLVVSPRACIEATAQGVSITRS